MPRILTIDDTGIDDTREIADTETVNAGNIAPLSGRLTIGGSAAQPDVYVANGHDFQVWGTGAELRTDAGADLIVGGSGSLQVPALGAHRIYGGTLSIEVPTNLSSTLTLVNGQTIATTNNGDIDFAPHGTGTVNIGSDFYATGFDLGDPANRAGTLYATTLDATNIIGTIATCGTNCDAWAVNRDIVGAVPEQSGSIWPGSDGSDVLAWRNRTDTNGILHTEYKVNPTDLTDLSEAGWASWIEYDNDQAELRCELDLTFPNGGVITTTNNGQLTIATNGTGRTVLNTAVLQTSAEPFIINYNANSGVGEVAGHIVGAGSGSGNVEAWRTRLIGPTSTLWFEHKTNPTDITDLTEAGYTQFVGLNPAGPYVDIQTDVLATGNDFGTAVNRLGTVYCTTLDATNIVGSLAVCGTACNVWEVNDDAAAGVVEDTGIALPAGDGANIQNFQFFNNSIAPEVILRYKQNPTDPADFAEAGYTPMITFATTRIVANLNVDANLGLDVSGGALTVDANGIDCAGNIDLNNTLSFDSAGNIDTSGNNDLTVNTGSGNYIVTSGNWNLAANGNVTTSGTEYDFTTNGIVEAQAGRLVLRASSFVQGDAPLVDLRTSVTDLDVPSGTGFQIGGVALTTANWTAPNVDTLLTGPASNADALHTHANLPSFASCGTTCDVWEVNDDVTAGVAENTGVALPASSGTNIENWQVVSDGAAQDLHFRYKQNPTDPADLAEAGYLTALILAQNGAAQLAGSLGISGTTIQFSGASGTLATAAGNLSVSAAGGAANIVATANLVDLRTNVTTLDVPSDVGFSIGGVALTTALWTATGVDTVFGGPASNADAYHTHSAIIGDGTISNIWVINEDAAAVTVEDAALIVEAGDGTNLQNWQVVNDSSSKELVFQYKQNPTDPKDIAEAGYITLIRLDGATPQAQFPEEVLTENGLIVTNVGITMTGLDIGSIANRAGTGYFTTIDSTSVITGGIDCSGNIDLNNTLSFDGAGFIDTSGNNNLTINTGTQNLLVTAGLVDLRTNVTNLDVPSGTGFQIGGVALTTANWTAPNVDTLLDGSNADALHTHSAVDADHLRIPGLTTAAMSQYQAAYISANNTVSPTNCSGGGSAQTATFAGVYDGTAGTLVNRGKVEVQFDAGLVAPAPAAGQVAYLSYTNNGQFTNSPPAAGSGAWISPAGLILDASSYGVNQRCVILVQPDIPVYRP